MNKNVKKNIFMCNRVTLLHKRNSHSVVNQLYFRKKKKKKSKTANATLSTSILAESFVDFLCIWHRGELTKACPVWFLIPAMFEPDFALAALLPVSLCLSLPRGFCTCRPLCLLPFASSSSSQLMFLWVSHFTQATFPCESSF